ncbi:lipid A deacylase LpxR family protein [Roseibacillus persicicus]|uniref:lipid A deacylase LpxR family protein n=1 Tax=Roseibacillus persicicus TaxID=454148 RepID=UPI00398B6C21
MRPPPKIAALAIGLFGSLSAEEKRSFELRWDNDSFLEPFGGKYTDRHYTQGLSFRYWHHDDEGTRCFLGSSDLMNALFHFGMDIEATRGGTSLGQEMYTPEDIAFGPSRFGVGYSLDAYQLQSDDRPYAGYLYLEPQWERRGLSSLFGFETVVTRDRFSVALGVVGPASGADDVQRRWHKLFNGVEPVGWRHQLDNEFAFTLHGERTWLFSTAEKCAPLSFDLMPTLGFDLGNVSTRLTAGLELRAGVGDIHEFSIPSQEVSDGGFGCYLFASAEGWAVGRNIFLDGNTFSDSHSVDKEYWVGEVSLGLGFQTPIFDGRLSWVKRSNEFKLQDEANSYLAIEAKVLF